MVRKGWELRRGERERRKKREIKKGKRMRDDRLRGWKGVRLIASNKVAALRGGRNQPSIHIARLLGRRACVCVCNCVYTGTYYVLPWVRGLRAGPTKRSATFGLLEY